MEFDWRGAVERNSEELCAIAARLIVMAGIQAGRMATSLPRHLYLHILSILRPAEYAARRLIVMAACKLVPDSGLPCAKEKAVGPSSNLAAQGQPFPRGKKEVCVTFALFDPFKRYGHPWLEPDELATPGAAGLRFALPPDEPVGVNCLCRRIRALANAVSDLEGQALRLARWRARRHLATCKPKRWSPLRPGRPPGYAKRPKTGIEELLKECHCLAREVWDTS